LITALSNNAEPCMIEGQEVMLFPSVFPSGNYTYLWTGPDGFSSDQVNASVSIVNASQAGSYRLTIENEECISEEAVTQVSFNLVPDKPLLDGDSLYCTDEVLHLEITNPDPRLDCRWIWSTPQGQIETNIPELEISWMGNNLLNGNYTVSQEFNGCRSETSEVLTVHFIDNSFAPSLTGPTSVCSGAMAVLRVNGMPDAVYRWITPDLDTLSTDVAQLEIDNFSAEDAGTYRVFIENMECSSQVSSPFDIDLVDIPEVPEPYITEFETCIDEQSSIEICITEPASNFDALELVDTSSGIVIASSMDTCILVQLNNTGQYEEYVLAARLVTGECRSGVSVDITLRVNSLAEDRTTVADRFIQLCGDNAVTLALDQASEGIDTEWESDDPNVEIVASDSGAVLNNLSSGLTNIYLNSISGSCGLTGRDTVTINTLNEINALEDQFVVEDNTPLVFDVLINDIFFAPVSFAELESPLLEASISGDRIALENPDQLFGQFVIRYTLCYTQCPDICDTGTLRIAITDTDDCVTGNIITPNGDGYNDRFMIPCLDSSFPDNSLVIFNQWGDEVYRAAPYHNSWEGTFENEDLPAGTYYFWLDLGDGNEPKTGFIVLER